MKLDPARVVLDDGKFELLLIPNPKNAVDLQNPGDESAEPEL